LLVVARVAGGGQTFLDCKIMRPGRRCAPPLRAAAGMFVSPLRTDRPAGDQANRQVYDGLGADLRGDTSGPDSTIHRDDGPPEVCSARASRKHVGQQTMSPGSGCRTRAKTASTNVRPPDAVLQVVQSGAESAQGFEIVLPARRTLLLRACRNSGGELTVRHEPRSPIIPSVWPPVSPLHMRILVYVRPAQSQRRERFWSKRSEGSPV